jgi:O-antigen ligase
MVRRLFGDTPERRKVADGLVAAVAASMPWSTSITAILLVLWLIALAPTLRLEDLRRELSTPAGGLPVALWALAVVGMLWADAGMQDRLHALGAFHKLLVIPLLLAQFRRSPNGWWVMLAFLLGSIALLVVSAALVFLPGLTWRGKLQPGVPVKDYISQSGVFTLCIFGLLWASLNDWTRPAWRWGGVLLATAFLANLVYIATARTAFVVVAVLALIFALRRFGWKGAVALGVLGSIVVGAAWYSSPYLRARVDSVGIEYQKYSSDPGTETSAGLRLEFWRKSLGFVAQAPLIGNGVGSIPNLFRSAATGDKGLSAVASQNPHNQTLAVAIQLGAVGAISLYAMWIAHLLLFRAPNLTAWIGLIVVVQNMVSSIFNSHIADFSQGWVYVVGVGVAGGMVLGGAQSMPQLRAPWAPRPLEPAATDSKLSV